MAVALVPAFCLSLFDDDKTLGAESEALLAGDHIGEQGGAGLWTAHSCSDATRA